MARMQAAAQSAPYVMLTRDKCNELFDQWVCDSAHTQRVLGWEPKVPFSEGVKKTVAWYQQAGWL